MTQTVTLVPRSGWQWRTLALSLVIVLVTGAMLIGSALLANYGSKQKYGLPFSLPDDAFWWAFVALNAAMLVIFLLVGLYSAYQELVWVHDATKGEIRLEERLWGRTIFVRRYPLDQAAGIRVVWQRTYSARKSSGGNSPLPGPGWWKAALVLWDGRSIHLHAIKGARQAAPADWLARFERACQLSGVILKQEEGAGTPPVAAIAARIKRGD